MDPLTQNQNTGAISSVAGTTVPSTVSATDINSTTPVNFPQTPVSTNLLAGLLGTATTNANSTNTAQTNAEDKYTNLLTQLGNESTDKNALEDQYGVTSAQRELLDLQKVANKQQADYIAGYVQAEGARNTRQETNIAQQNLTRQHGIDALLTNSLISAKQGDVTYANTLVDRAIAAKYDPIKAQINAQKFILDQINTKAAENRKTVLDLKLRQIDQQADQEKLKQGLILDAAKAGISPDLINQARNATTPEQAATILGVSPDVLIDRQLKQANIANIYSQIAKNNAEAMAANNKKNFVTPPLVNPVTGKLDPTAQLASVIQATGIKDNTNLQNILGVVTATQNFAQNNPSGTFDGIAFGNLIGGHSMFASPKGIANSSDIEAINLKVQQWASGAALTDAQTKQVEKITPKYGDTNSQLRSKTNALADFMQGQAQSLLATQGINYKPEPIDYFNKNLSTLSNDKLLSTIPSSPQSSTTDNATFFDGLTTGK